MSIEFKKGDLFSQPVDALVNTVNCVGVMGKGVALEFKRRWPINFSSYKRLCDAKTLRPGTLYIHELGGLFGGGGPKFIVNFPTKDHWRAQSKLEYIEAGLDALVESLRVSGISSIALPPLGCGNGGLAWSDVKPLIQKKLAAVEGVSVIVLEPAESLHEAPEHRVADFAMTYPRAVLIKALGDLAVYFDGSFDRISLQKIVYFLQALGVQYNLSFRRNLFGPYSETLRRSLATFEKHDILTGFTSKERLSNVTAAAYAQADEFLIERKQADDAQHLIDKLNRLIEGYEGPYGLELLSSVHHLASAEGIRPADAVVGAMANWNENKRNRFSSSVIKTAYLRLRDDGLLPQD
jgi:O-acetyl-ADP-ribose deacetylase (regulator of RNase III)